MTTLVIVESPKKTKSVGKYLGDNYKVVSSVGHIRDLPLKELGVNLETFEPKYVTSEGKTKTVKSLKEMAKNSDEVILATDWDREGEAIAWHLAQVLGLKDPKRVVYKEITQSAIEKAFANPTKIKVSEFHAQQGRRVLDRLIGYLVSPIVSKLNNQYGLSAGRVQSVALLLLVEREREIDAFVKKDHFTVDLVCENDGIEWKARWDTKPHVDPDNPYIIDRSIAEAVSQCSGYVVTDVKEGESKEKAPPPFTTVTMQKAASIKLKLTSSEAMKAAQLLYDNGLISYLRTDSPNLSDEAITNIREFLTENGLSDHLPEKPPVFKAGESAQEGHEAIRPTDIALKTVDDKITGSGKEIGNAKELYKLIRLRAIASQMNPAIYKTKKVTITGDQEIPELDNDKPVFKANGKTLVYKGWKHVVTEDQSSEDEKDAANLLPDINSNDEINPSEVKVVGLSTKPPKRYSEPALVEKLEKSGIGRPSTYAAIIKNIEDKGYVLRKKNIFYPQENGFKVVDSLVDRFDFMRLSFTKDMEDKLDSIAANDATYLDVVSEFYSLLEENIGSIELPKKPSYPCPECGADLIRRNKDKPWWGCSAFRETGCKGSMDDKDGKPVPKKTPQNKTSTVYPCPECERPLRNIPRKDKSGSFWGCSGYSKGCEFTTNDNEGKPVLEECSI